MHEDNHLAKYFHVSFHSLSISKVALKLVQNLGRHKQSKMYLEVAVFPLLPLFTFFTFIEMSITLSEIECLLNFENRPVRSRDIKQGRKQPPPPATKRGTQEAGACH